MSLWRSLFGPSREEIWRQLCAETGAEYVDGGFWKGSKVQAQHGPWTITLDTFTVRHGKHSHTYTRFRAPFVNRGEFRFSVSRSGFFTELGKTFGMQDVDVGFPEFDSEFVIQGNDETLLRELFASERVRDLLREQPSVDFSVRDDEGWFSVQFPEGVDELRFAAHGVIRDVNRLKSLYDLFAEVLEQLCAIGAAEVKDPDVRL